MTTTIHVNARGSLTLPQGLRRNLGLEKGGVLMAELSDAGILLRPAVTYPVEIYSARRVMEFDAADRDLALHLKRKAGT